jgi:hypothetical protein
MANSQMIANLLASVMTFRRDIKAKLAFILLNWIDLSLTLFAVTIGANELNPLMRNLIDSPVLIYAAKLVIPLFLAWLLPGIILAPSIGLLVLVVGWNVKEILVFFF